MKQIVIILLVIYTTKSQAQQVIMPVGGNIKSKGGSASFSMFYSSPKANSIIAQSVQTPYDLYYINGVVKTPNGKLINTANIVVSGNIASNFINNSYGKYNFNVPKGMYTLKVKRNKNITKANGVTTADVVLVQRHILNLAKLNSPYKLIAADVTNDKIINSTDIIRMKRLILGLDTTFTGNRLWAFVDSAYQFPDTTNPFPYKDSISFTNLTSNKTNQTFIGVKLGDVNYDWNATVARQSIVNGQQPTALKLIAELPNQIPNTQFQIPIKVSNFKQLNSFQYTLHFDNSKYEFVNLEGFKNLQGLEWNATQANQTGNIAMLWVNAKGEEASLEDGTLLFKLVLQPKELGIANNLDLKLNNDITDIEAWDKDYDKHQIVLKTKSKNEPVQMENIAISPNPTTGNIKVNVIANTNKEIVFELSNAYGKTLLQQGFEAIKGNNVYSINLNKNGKLAAGIYLLKVVGIAGENVKRIIVE